MFILYFALWVVLNGRWTTEIGLFGVAFAAIAYLFTCRFMGYSPSVDFALIKRAPHAVRYGALLMVEIVKANLTVMRMILDRSFEPKPQLVQFDVNLKRERHRVALANSITLTPGTITVNLEDNHYTVHCLDTSLMDGLDDGEMVRTLEAFESAHAVADDAKAAQAEPAAADQAAEAVEAVEIIEAAQAVEIVETAEAEQEPQADAAAEATDEQAKTPQETDAKEEEA